MESALIQAVMSGIVGGVIAGGVALAAIKVHIHYIRRDVDHAHRRIDRLTKHV